MNLDQNMSELANIKSEDRRVANIRDGKFVTLFSDGVKDGSVLQLNDAKPLGSGFHIYRMDPGEATVAHKHFSDEEFYIIEGEIVGDELTEEPMRTRPLHKEARRLRLVFRRAGQHEA